jgi:hypothetical protein
MPTARHRQQQRDQRAETGNLDHLNSEDRENEEALTRGAFSAT